MTSPPKPPDPEFQAALARHLAGHLAEAERLYQDILATRPGHPDALHLTGVIKVQSGQPLAAIDWIGRAIATNPDVAIYHSNLAKALGDAGRHAEAIESCRRAVEIDPDCVDAHVNLGFEHNHLGQGEEAVACFRRALALKPDHLDARANLGAVLCKLGRLNEAEAEYSALMLRDPNTLRAYVGLGAIRHEQRRFAEAARLHREALRLSPASADAHSNLGITLLELGRIDEAEAACRHALRLDPNFAPAHSNLGLVLTERGLFTDGEAHLRQAISAAPGLERNLANLASALVEQGRSDEALACYQEVVRLYPDSADAKANLGIMLLQLGQFDEGWQLYESRRAVSAASRRPLSSQAWSGETAPEQLLLVQAEQGYGDIIQFCRYLSLAAERCRVVVQAPSVLRRLIGTVSGVERVLEPGEEVTADFHCSMLGLPLVFATTLGSIPASVPYLSADASAVAVWRDRLADWDGLKIGLAWAGSPSLRHDRRRSINPALLTDLLDTPGVRFISLQKDSPPPRHANLTDWTAELDDFADTAALIEALDLVISVDTAVVHLAGALGKPAWLLNRFAPDWRWMLGCDDSAWYPSLRQFRQAKPDEWSDVLVRVAAELGQMVGARLCK